MKKKNWVSISAIVISLLMLIIPVGNYYLALLKSFIFHFMIGYFVLAVFWLLKRKFLSSTVSALGSLVLLLFLLPSNTKQIDINVSGQTLKVAHFNVLKINKDYAGVIFSAKSKDADFLSFQEIDSKWKKQLIQAFSKDFPYYKVEAKDHDCHGIAVFSKYPFKDVEVLYVEGVANIHGVLNMKGKPLVFMTTHTSSPITKKHFYARNKQIDSVADILGKPEMPVLAIGDYNAVPWDRAIIDFKEKTGLKDSRKTLSPTYPRLLGVFGIPIDYIFHSDRMVCKSFYPIYSSSSDHAGIYGEYTL